ncbi:hypothetical protein ABG067_006373 [Albugo candida]|uniref:Uncharacterized protein n=1 Tax=Albugo candida TaxID=65357 RepID=A0A024GUS7_9STRA|nr:unnamed protein product [Albugo candida]|eukprot:CCI50543.1 unnamed protein product [Albugo candida]
MLSELEVTAIIVAITTFSLLAFAIKVWFPKKKDKSDEYLDEIVNGFDVTIPEEAELYRKLKEEKPNDTEALFNMLFRRAVALVPLIRKVQSESVGIQRLRRNDILKDGSFINYKWAEELVTDEISEIRVEADFLKPGEGWADKIFPQAVQFLSHMAEQRQQTAPKNVAKDDESSSAPAQPPSPDAKNATKKRK